MFGGTCTVLRSTVDESEKALKTKIKARPAFYLITMLELWFLEIGVKRWRAESTDFVTVIAKIWV